MIQISINSNFMEPHRQS